MRKMPIRLPQHKIASFCQKHHIIYLAFFGSVLTSKFTQESDVDILVKFEKKHIPHLFALVNIESELTDIVGRPVDLRTPNDLSPYFRDEVIAKAHPIYGK